MRVLFVVAEVAPFSKVGGLADVAGALPQALHALGHDVRVITPRYGPVDEGRFGLRPLLGPYSVPIDVGAEPAALRAADRGPVPVYFVENGKYFAFRQRIYGDADDLDRFVFFGRAALEGVRRLGWRPEVIHVNDWHAAIVPVWLKTWLRDDPFYGGVASVLTIHNLAFQGWFDEPFRQRWDLVPWELVARPLAGVDPYRVLALGIAAADVVSTVSPTYAQEICGPELGEGLDPLLRARRERLFGILNGIDQALFDPATDPNLVATYDRDHLERKAANKEALQREARLAERPEMPLIGLVSRLTDQKGLDLVAEALPLLLEEAPVQFVLLGSGEERYERSVGELVRRYPDRAAAKLGFDAALAQRIYAGADLFLMPSRFEPCGLGQMIALRYGTVPIVRRTGGLADTVEDVAVPSGAGTGFVFQRYAPGALLVALGRALEAYRHRSAWRQLQRRGMEQDFSWERSARRYEELYRLAVAERRKEIGNVGTE